MTFGERIVRAREKKGLNQKQLAELLEISPTRLNYWEKDKREPDVPMIWKLIEVLDVSGDWLIGHDDSPIGFFQLARLNGFEPSAYRLGGGRSIQLSYRRVSQLKRYIIRVGLSSNSK